MPEIHYHVIQADAGYLPNSDGVHTRYADDAFEAMMTEADSFLDYMADTEDQDETVRGGPRDTPWTVKDDIKDVERQMKTLQAMWADEDGHTAIALKGALIVLEGGTSYIEMAPCIYPDCELDDD